MSDIYDPASPEFQNLAELARKRREEINQFSAQIRAEEQARRDYYKALREEKYRDWPSLLNDSDYDFLETAQTVIDNPSFEGDRELERDRLYATAFYAGKLHHPMRAVFLNLDEYHKQWTGQNFTRKTGIQAVIDSVGFSMESARYNHLTKQWANAGGKNDDPLLEEINESSRRIERLKDHAPKVWEDEYISQGGGADIFAFLRSAFVTTGENFVPLAAGIGVGALAATGVGALGTAAGLSAKAAGLIAVGASKTAIGANTYSSGWGTKYKQFRDEGFPHDISLKWAKIDEAMAGAVEGAIGGIESAAIAGIVKNVAPTLASRAINKLFIKGKLGAAAKTTLKILAQAGEEGVLEEIPQGLGSGWARNMAVDEANARRAEQYEKRMAELEERYQKLGEPITASVMEEFDRYMNENYPEMKKEEWDDILKGALQDGIAAFSSTLITGGMGEAFGAIRHKGTFGKTIRSSQQLAEMAKDSLNVAELAEKVDAAKKAGYEPPYSEGLKTEAEAALLSDIYKAQQERLTPEEREDRQLKARGAEALAEVTDYSNADVEDVAELDERGKPTGDTAPEFFTNAEGDIFRENGRLETAEYTEEAEGGGIEGRFVAGDPRKPEADGNRYGYINYTEKDGAVTIDEFKMLAGYEKLRGGLYRQFAETHAGQNIIWNPKNEGNIALREEIAANNPRGPKYGLDYFEDAGQSAASAEATRAARRFAPYLKNSTPLETALAVETFGSFYRRRGESLDGAMNRLIGKVTNEAPDAVAAAQRAGKTVKGATWIEQTAEGARRIIYVSKNAADGSTVVHEISHAVAADFTEAERNIAARALNGYRLKSGTRVSFEENAAWGEEQQEAFAEALENYLTNGTAPNEEIKGLFERIKEFMGRIYRTMKGWTELSPQAEAFYQSLLSGELVDRAKTAVGGLTPREVVRAQQREAVITSPDISLEAKAQAVLDAAGAVLMQAVEAERIEDDLQAEKPYYKANVQKNVNWLLNADPAAEIPENAIDLNSLEGKDFVDKIYNFFFRNKTTQVTRGDWKINITKSGIKASRKKGLGGVKINVFAALPEIITGGIITDVNRNWKGRSYDSYIIDAPLTIGTTEYIAEVIVNRIKDGTGNYYLHEVEEKSKLHGASQTGYDPRTPEGASKLNISRLLEKSKAGNENTVALFQTGDSDMVEEAATFENGKDYRGYIEAFSQLPSEVEEFTDEQIDIWFEEFVQNAKKAVRSGESTEEDGAKTIREGQELTPADRDAEFIEIISEPAALDKFLKAVKVYNNEDYGRWQAEDEEDAAERDRQQEIGDRVQKAMSHPMWKAFFMKKGEITDGHKKRLLGLLRNYPREYRAVYAEVMNHPDLAVSAEDATAEILKHRIADSRAVNVDSLSPEKLSQLAEQLDIEEYAEKVRTGKAKFDDETERKYVKQLETRRGEAEKALREAEADRDDDNRFIERVAGKQFTEIFERALKAREEMTVINGKLDRAIKNRRKDAGRIARRAVRTKATYDGIMETLTALAGAHQLEIDVREALSDAKLKDYAKSAKAEATLLARLARKAGASETRTRLAEIKEQHDKLKALSDARRKVVKRTFRAVNPREVNAEQGRAIAIIQRLVEPSMLKGIDRLLGGIEKPYLRSIFETWKTDELLREGILRDNRKSSREKINRLFGKENFDELTGEEKKYLFRVLPSIDWATAMGLEEIIERRDLAYPMESAEEAQRIAFKHLPADVYYRVMDKGYTEWTLAEIEELAEIIDRLFVQGKEIYKANKDHEKKRIREYQDAIRETILAVPFWKRKLLADSGDTPEEKARKQAEMEKIIGKYKDGRKSPAYADMGIRRYARMLDNGDPEGRNSALLVRRKDDAYNQKMAAIDARMERMRDVMKKLGIKGGELWKTAVEIDLGGDMGKTEFTNGKLIGIVSASRNEYSRDATVYGSLLTEAERGKYQYDGITGAELAPLLTLAEERFGKVEAAAEKIMAEKPQYRQLMEAIDEDFAVSGPRVNEARVRYNNNFMPVEEFYFSIIRKAPVTSRSADVDLKRALLGGSGGAFNLFVEQGFMEGRKKIPPQYQTEIELDILSVFTQAVNREEHFMAYAELVRDMNRIYKDSRQVRDAIQRRYGRGAVKFIDSYINALANPESEKVRTSIDNWIRTLSGNVTTAYLALNITSIVKQGITSPAPFFGYMNPLEYAAASFDFAAHYTERWQEIQELSKYMKHRSPNLLVDFVKKMAGREGMSEIDKAVSGFNEKGMIGLTLVDRFCVAPGWYALFKKQYKVLTNDPNGANMTEKDRRVKAARYADNITNLIQPNANIEEQAPMFREGNELQKALLRFQSALSPIWQTFKYDLPQMIHDKRYWNAAGTIIGYTMAGIIVGALFTGFDDDDDEGEKAAKLAFWAVSSFTSAAPLIGAEVTQAAEMIITGGRTSYRGGFNLFPTLLKTTEAVNNAAQGIREEDFEKILKASAAALEAAFMAKGLPVSGTKQIGSVMGIGDGDGEPGFNPAALFGNRN